MHKMYHGTQQWKNHQNSFLHAANHACPSGSELTSRTTYAPMFPFQTECSLLLYDSLADVSRRALRCTSRTLLYWGDKKTCVILWAVQMCLRDMGFLRFELPHIGIQLRQLQFATYIRLGFLSDLARALLGALGHDPNADFGTGWIDPRKFAISQSLLLSSRWTTCAVSYTAGILWTDAWRKEHKHQEPWIKHFGLAPWPGVRSRSFFLDITADDEDEYVIDMDTYSP